MDQQTAPTISAQDRSDIYDDLFRTVYQGMEKGEISETDAQESAEYILSQLDTIQATSDLLKFLEELAKRYPIYSNLYLLKKSQLNNMYKVEQIQNHLDNMGGTN